MNSLIKLMGILLISIVIWYIFSGSGDSVESTKNDLIDNIELDSTPLVESRDFKSTQLFADNDTDEKTTENSLPTQSPSPPPSEECKQQLNIRTNELVDILADSVLEEDKQLAFMLSGVDYAYLAQADTLSNAEREARVTAITRRRIELLNANYSSDETGLLSQIYLEECATNSYPAFCSPEELLSIAETNPNDLSSWLLLLRYYRNQGKEQQVKEIFNKALNSQSYKDFDREYSKKVFNEYLRLTNSPTLAMLALGRSERYGTSGFGDFIKYCNDQLTDDCYRIGELLERESDSFFTRDQGINMQVGYLLRTGQTELAEAMRVRQDEQRVRYYELSASIKLPLDDQLAIYGIEIQDLGNDYERALLLKQEAQRLLEDNPDLCIM